jgi:two-component system, cell cycle response regulator
MDQTQSPLVGYSLSTVITVGALGISDSDRRVLTSIFALSARRTPRYALLDKAETKQGDILLVASDQTRDLDYGKHWQSTRQRPVIIAGFATPRLNVPVIARPLNIVKVLATLDQAVETLKAAISLANPAGVISAAGTSAGAAPAVTYAGVQSNFPHQDEPAKPEFVNTEPLKVLVVDDSKAVQIYMQDKLKRWSLEPVIASLGEEAMWACAKNSFDVVFLDVQMPGIDGYEVCKRIRSDRNNKNAKVFMLTSRSGAFDKVRGKLAGCDIYLTKPVDPDRLSEIIEAEIAAKRKRPVRSAAPPAAASVGLLNPASA